VLKSTMSAHAAPGAVAAAAVGAGCVGGGGAGGVGGVGGVGAGGVGAGGAGIQVPLDPAAGISAAVAAGRSAAQVLIERELKERDLKEAQRRLNALETQAEELFASGEYAAALKVFVDITGTGGAVLQWSDQVTCC
jgi:hypothetical protein